MNCLGIQIHSKYGYSFKLPMQSLWCSFLDHGPALHTAGALKVRVRVRFRVTVRVRVRVRVRARVRVRVRVRATVGIRVRARVGFRLGLQLKVGLELAPWMSLLRSEIFLIISCESSSGFFSRSAWRVKLLQT